MTTATETTGKKFMVAPDPLFIDPITGNIGKWTIYSTANYWTKNHLRGTFNTWREAYLSIHPNALI